MTEILILALLGSVALLGIAWTIWDIRSDLRRKLK